MRATLAPAPTAAFCAALALCAAVLPSAAAQPQEIDLPWQSERRTVTHTSGPTVFTAASLRDSALGRDRVDVLLDVDDGRLSYSFTDLRNGTVLEAVLLLQAVVEFQDNDGDGRFGVGDTLVRRVDLTRGAQATQATLTAAPDLTGAVTAVATFTIPPPERSGPDLIGNPVQPPGKLTLAVRIAPMPERAAPATALQVAVRVESFPFQSDGGLVALAMRLEGQPALSSGPHAGRQLQASVDDYRLSFGWGAATTPTVVGDGGGTGVDVLWSYPDLARNDDQATFETQRFLPATPAEVVRALREGDWLVYSLGAVAAAAIVGVPALARVRRGP